MHSGAAEAVIRVVEPPSAHRIQELLSTVFVRGGNVAGFIKKLKTEVQYGHGKEEVVSTRSIWSMWSGGGLCIRRI